MSKHQSDDDFFQIAFVFSPLFYILIFKLHNSPHLSVALEGNDLIFRFF